MQNSSESKTIWNQKASFSTYLHTKSSSGISQSSKTDPTTRPNSRALSSSKKTKQSLTALSMRNKISWSCFTKERSTSQQSRLARFQTSTQTLSTHRVLTYFSSTCSVFLSPYLASWRKSPLRWACSCHSRERRRTTAHYLRYASSLNLSTLSKAPPSKSWSEQRQTKPIFITLWRRPNRTAPNQARERNSISELWMSKM